MRRNWAIRKSYRDFASAFGTAWLVVIVLAFVTGGRIGRWGAVILPVQILGSLAYALLKRSKRRAEKRRRELPQSEGPRYLPI